MGIKVSKTYQTVTPESAELGQLEDQGFIFEDVDYTFIELVELLQEHPIASCSHGMFYWSSCEVYIDDYSTCETISFSIHCGDDDRSRRYWEKAVRYLGLDK